MASGDKLRQLLRWERRSGNRGRGRLDTLLRWRQGEYEALFRLGSPQKDAILPLIEILKPDYDFEQRKPKRDLDEHLKLFGKRLGKQGVRLMALAAIGGSFIASVTNLDRVACTAPSYLSANPA